MSPDLVEPSCSALELAGVINPRTGQINLGEQ